MALSYDYIILIACLFVGIAGISYFAIKLFWQERKLKQSEIRAELEMLVRKQTNK